jgi:hypothetical protein
MSVRKIEIHHRDTESTEEAQRVKYSTFCAFSVSFVSAVVNCLLPDTLLTSALISGPPVSFDSAFFLPHPPRKYRARKA